MELSGRVGGAAEVWDVKWLCFTGLTWDLDGCNQGPRFSRECFLNVNGVRRTSFGALPGSQLDMQAEYPSGASAAGSHEDCRCLVQPIRPSESRLLNVLAEDGINAQPTKETCLATQLVGQEARTIRKSLVI